MLSPNLQNLLSDLKDPQKQDLSQESAGPVISINSLTNKAGTWYERVRYLFDYKEERFIRRSAIGRILKRKLFFGESENFGLNLLQELIRAGYLPNNSVPENMATEVERVAMKYMQLADMVEKTHGGNQEVRKNIISFAASGIHRILFPSALNETTVDTFYASVRNRVVFSPRLSDKNEEIQVYIACRRSLLKETDEELAYALWLKLVPRWTMADHHIYLGAIAEETPKTLDCVWRYTKDSIGWRVALKLKNYGISFFLIKELVQKFGAESGQVLQDSTYVDQEIEQSLQVKYLEEHRRTRKSSYRAIIYIFFTKMLLAFVLELPYDLWVLGAVNYTALGMNAVFHPFLLFGITTSILPLGKKNTEEILAVTHRVLYDQELGEIHLKTNKGSSFFDSLFFILYGILFTISFGIIITVLRILDFNIVSMIMFLFFLTLVSYFGIRIRRNAKDWKVHSDEESATSILWNALTFPIVRAGRWLSETFSSINVFIFIMDFLVEAPFKLILQTLDAFLSFLKEKREEMY